MEDLEDAPAITSFSDEHRFLSNFWPAPVILDGVEYPSVENAYQAAKTDDLEARKAFVGITAGQAKRLGKTVKMREGWDILKVGVMTNLVTQKFQIPELREMLLATGSAELIEGNTWNDTFWGVCRGKGQNILGNIIMAVRRNLASAE